MGVLEITVVPLIAGCRRSCSACGVAYAGREAGCAPGRWRAADTRNCIRGRDRAGDSSTGRTASERRRIVRTPALPAHTWAAVRTGAAFGRRTRGGRARRAERSGCPELSRRSRRA